MVENIPEVPRPQWLEAEKERLEHDDTPIFHHQGNPTMEEVALRQLMEEAAMTELKDGLKFVPKVTDPKETNPGTIKRIIEKVKQI